MSLSTATMPDTNSLTATRVAVLTTSELPRPGDCCSHHYSYYYGAATATSTGGGGGSSGNLVENVASPSHSYSSSPG